MKLPFLPGRNSETTRRAAKERNAKLFDFMDERELLKKMVVDRVVQNVKASDQERALEYALNEAAYLEMQRLARDGVSKYDLHDYGFWREIAKKLGKATQIEKQQVLRQIVGDYAEDVAGQFTPSVYWFASSVLPIGLNALFNAQRIETLRNFRQLSDSIIINGAVEHVRKLADKGTIVVVPTHSSNLDSILVGWTLEETKLPPVTYGAGKNLFSNRLISYFMHNLGAYKVDRRIRHSIYKSVLKTYSEVLLERGYHQLFFPGGTRSRSNRVENKLKLGLLGTALKAFTHNHLTGKPKPDVFVCPLTINYHLVLEAQTLIDEYLRRDGGARYIISDDEFSDIKLVTRFAMNMMSMDYTQYMRFGQPLDVFGNLVDEEGKSLDPRGRSVEPVSYLQTGGQIVEDASRDAQFTRECGEAIGRSFKENTVALSSGFLAFAAFHYLRELYKELDLYRLLRVIRGELIPFDALYPRAERLRELLLGMADRGQICVGEEIRDMPLQDLIDRAAKILGMYHTSRVFKVRSNGLEVGNPNLLYFYSNRLAGYGLPKRLSESLDAPTFDMRRSNPG